MSVSELFNPDIVDVGYVHLFGKDEFLPDNTWKLAEGQEMDIQEYPELFKKIGYTFGGAKGYFKLPNMKPENSIDREFIDLMESDFITNRFAIKVK